VLFPDLGVEDPLPGCFIDEGRALGLLGSDPADVSASDPDDAITGVSMPLPYFSDEVWIGGGTSGLNLDDDPAAAGEDADIAPNR